MDIEEFKNSILEYSDIIKYELKKEQIEKLYKYMCLLIEWNKKFNLTAIVEPKEIILKHFIDSLTIMEEIPKCSNVIDVGTGAGLPGIPIKICREDINIVLLDSLNKRVNFLNEVIDCLKLKNIQAVHDRAEDYVKDHREVYDVAMSRAVANLPTLSEYLIPFVKVGGKIIAMKGLNIEEELQESKNAIKILGGEIKEVKEISLLRDDLRRNNIIIEKTINTPIKYPRKAGIPLKKPIK